MDTSRAFAYRAGVAVGVALVLVGLVAYVASDFASITALIPAFLGVGCVFLGRLGTDADRDQVATYGLGLIAAVGLSSIARAYEDLLELLTGGEVDSVLAVSAQGATILLSLVLLVAVLLALASER